MGGEVGGGCGGAGSGGVAATLARGVSVNIGLEKVGGLRFWTEGKSDY